MAFYFAFIIVFPAVVARKVAIAKGYSQWVGIILGGIGSFIGMFITFMLNEDKTGRA